MADNKYGSSFNTFKEEAKEEAIKTEPKPVKKEYRVNLIIGNSALILVDGKGNGIKVPMTEKNKNAKIGDILYL